jgi:hypothetical protein
MSRANGTVGGAYPWTMSLIAHSEARTGAVQVTFVHWQSANSKTGRPVSLDEHQKAIWPTAATTPSRPYRDSTVVHPDFGVNLRRSKADRSEIPENIRILKQFWELACSSHLDPTSGVLSPECQVCCASDSREPISICAVCRLHWHISCCERALQTPSQYKLEPVVGDSTWVPNILTRTVLCGLCSEWLQALPLAGEPRPGFRVFDSTSSSL